MICNKTPTPAPPFNSCHLYIFLVIISVLYTGLFKIVNSIAKRICTVVAFFYNNKYLESISTSSFYSTGKLFSGPAKLFLVESWCREKGLYPFEISGCRIWRSCADSNPSGAAADYSLCKRWTFWRFLAKSL